MQKVLHSLLWDEDECEIQNTTDVASAAVYYYNIKIMTNRRYCNIV